MKIKSKFNFKTDLNDRKTLFNQMWVKIFVMKYSLVKARLKFSCLNSLV